VHIFIKLKTVERSTKTEYFRNTFFAILHTSLALMFIYCSYKARPFLRSWTQCYLSYCTEFETILHIPPYPGYSPHRQMFQMKVADRNYISILGRYYCYCCSGLRLCLCKTAASNGPLSMPPYDTSVNMEQRWNDTDRGKPKDSEKKTCPSATLSTTNSATFSHIIFFVWWAVLV
jgi:hypothetical protein